MDRSERQGLFIEKFCSLINYSLPLAEQTVSRHYNSPISILIRRYNQPAFSLPPIAQPREYHGFSHAVDCCFALDSCWEEVARQYGLKRSNYDSLFFALAYHDVVYDTHTKTEKTNEQQSAEFARQQLLAVGVSPEMVANIVELIEETDHSIPIADDATPSKRLIRDIDLIELGADWTRFDHNFAAIRAEYSWVPEQDFMLGRMRFMEAMIARPHIFATSYFRSKLERAARANIERHIAELEQIVDKPAVS
tara:strand:+ start:14455 stop:15207 length:753 start_codon:yes stop_codon:yes gene_type:complete